MVKLQKGCFYWILIGFWLEPIIWILKFIFALICSALSDLFTKISENNKNYHKEWNTGQDGFNEIKEDLKEELKEEIREELYEEIYETIINDIENK